MTQELKKISQEDLDVLIRRHQNENGDLLRIHPYKLKLHGYDLTFNSFCYSNLDGMQLSQCVLSSNSLRGTILTNARIIHCKLFKVNFSTSSLQGIDFSRTSLAGCLLPPGLKAKDFVGSFEHYQHLKETKYAPKSSKAVILNYTPHDIHVQNDREEICFFKSFGSARVESPIGFKISQKGKGSFIINNNVTKAVKGLPKAKKGVFLIVSLIVKNALLQRQDLLCPDSKTKKEVRGKEYVTRFIR